MNLSEEDRDFIRCEIRNSEARRALLNAFNTSILIVLIGAVAAITIQSVSSKTDNLKNP